MSLPLKKWNILNEDHTQPLVQVLIKNRGLAENHLEKFRLSERLHDPHLLKDMDVAVERILRAVNAGEKIAVFGDYDVDGVTSTAMMIKFFEKIQYPVSFYLPHREKDGYGLRPPSVQQALDDKTDLLITVDNGITSNDAVDLANENGMDVIITDHHVKEGELPGALAVVNPNRKDSKYPFRGICGAGVVYKLFHALGQKLFAEDDWKSFMITQLDLLTIATIADVVPLIDENYAIVKFGLQSLTRTKRPGLVELKRISGVLGKSISPMMVGYYLGPRLNAAGRLESAELALRLLLSRSLEEAAPLAKALDKLNQQRQKTQEKCLKKAEKDIDDNNQLENRVLIVFDENWEPGLIGLISGRLKERYYRPALAFTRDADGNYVGSGRSIESFNITEALTKFNKMFLNYGGHKKAAGVTVAAEYFTEFIREFTGFANTVISDNDLTPDLTIDSVIAADQLNKSTVELIEAMGPFGEGNPDPVLMLRGAWLKDVILMSNGLHLKLLFELSGNVFEAVWWRQGEQSRFVRLGADYDIAFKPGINTWNGREKLQLVIEDIRPSSD